MNKQAVIQQWPEGLSDLSGTTSASAATSESMQISPFHAKVRLPEEFLLGRLLDARLRVAQPLAVKVTRENRHVIVEATEINEFGFGANLSEALSDLQATVGELYFALERDADRLGPYLERVWLTLRDKITRRP